MAFKQPCFIRKNTPELRKKLEELGYEANSYECFWDDENRYIITTIGSNGFAFYTLCIKNCCILENKEFIDCGDNEELFIALAALRNDSDKNQYFICDKVSFTIGKTYYPDDYLYYQYDEFFDKQNWHKATVEEIIEHFKKE
jgi:hypothetical protein